MNKDPKTTDQTLGQQQLANRRGRRRHRRR
jgi:hypothetical protein